MEKEEDKLTPQQQLEFAQSWRQISLEHEQFATQRIGDMEDQFVGLQVQIAAILVAFSQVFIGNFSQQTFHSIITRGILKTAFAIGVFFLIASLGFGLVQLRRRGMFWNKYMRRYLSQFNNWNAASRKDIDYDKARAFHKGTVDGEPDIDQTPKWPWVLQSICLAVAITVLFVVFVTFIINS